MSGGLEVDLLLIFIIVRLRMKIANLQSLMGCICAMSFKHHVAASRRYRQLLPNWHKVKDGDKAVTTCYYSS